MKHRQKEVGLYLDLVEDICAPGVKVEGITSTPVPKHKSKSSKVQSNGIDEWEQLSLFND